MSKIKEYRLGDMILQYLTDDEGHTGLRMLPADCPVREEYEKKAAIDSLVQVKISGDVCQGGYAQGNTMRGSESTMRLRFENQAFRQEKEEQIIETVLWDDRGYEAVHRVRHQKGDPFVTMDVTYRNLSHQPVMLELLSSFSITGISPYLPSDCSGGIRVHRLQSRWSQEGRLLTQTLEELQLEPSWGMGAVRCERFGQVGSMPVNHYFPFLAVEDTKTGVFWGAQLVHPASWQMEIYRKDENIAVSGGLADREFGHWRKLVEPREEFSSPRAIVTVAKTDSIDLLTHRLTEACARSADQGPGAEQELPIIFNEYCTTWGCPSHKNIQEILGAIDGKGFDYFVIDCGWFKADGVPWDISMGDYLPSETLFPEGLGRTVEAIHEKGMKAGIWFEIENVGPASDAWQKTEHLLHLDGHVITTAARRFWNMNDPWVKEYLRDRVIGTLKKYSFDYMKIDYNDTIGIGCDGAESPGEGLRRNMQATMEFLDEIKREIPGIILENCASGGHRLEPGFMAACSMASFSDAHECVEIPIIAANLHRAILPRQSQIWSVIRKDDSPKRIVYSVASTFLGRMCISGDVTDLTAEQWSFIDQGIAFYRKIAPVIKRGQTFRYGPEVKEIRHPKGWQAVVRVGENQEAFALIHTFGGDFPEVIELPLPESAPDQIEQIYSDVPLDVEIRDRKLYCRMEDNWRALAVYLKGDLE